MATIKIILPDKSVKKVDTGTTPAQIAAGIGPRLAQDAYAAKVNGRLIDLSTPLDSDCELQIITGSDPEGIEVLRHSAAHILAESVTSLFPDAKPTIGPVIENGFYYDFDYRPFTPEDIQRIEEKMNELVRKKAVVKRVELSKKEAVQMFASNKYKVEMIKEMEGVISAYRQGDWIDLCRGPHLPDMGRLRAFKLTKAAGAYWRGDAKNAQLQRIYGTAWPDKDRLKEYLTRLEEAERRDHRRLGKELELFSLNEEGQGFPFWHAKGTIIVNELKEFLRQENRKRGYNEIITPPVLDASLWKKSGHWDHFKENMYFTKIDNQEYSIKPMNCPGGLLIYNTRLHSYRELPLRNAEFGLVHRHELSGVLHGLLRVRSFTQDDSHSFCTEDQMESEIKGMVEYAIKIYKTFGFGEYEIYIATKPEKAMGDDKVWEKATDALRSALKKMKLPFKIKEGEGAFYGPKIEFNIKDAIGRNWQCGTIQVDFSMPDKLGATYEGEDGKKHVPVMIHRAIVGSIERFIGILIEHFIGKFPLWISPEQVIVLTVADRHTTYADKVVRELKDVGLRVVTDYRSESIPKKVRDAQLRKVNYILVLGDAEEKNETVNIRTRDNVVHGEKKVLDLINVLQKEITEKKLNSDK